MLELVKKLSKKVDVYFIILIVISILFLYFYTYLPRATLKTEKFLSPDETANYFFIKHFAQTGELTYQLEVYDNVLDYYPRSATILPGGEIAPGSFIGMFLLYGWLAKIFGLKLIVFFTPILALIGILFFYGFCKNVFNRLIAFISSCLLFIHPAYLYYTNRGMFHNIVFIVFLIIGLFFLIKIVRCPKYIHFGLAGLFLSLAIIIRTSEVLWLAPLIIILIVYWLKKNISRRNIFKIIINLFIFIILFLLPLLIISYYQNKIWGHPLASGYGAITNQVINEGGGTFFSWLSVIFFTRFNFYNIVNNFFNYFLKLLPQVSSLSVIIIIYLLSRWKILKKPIRSYLIFFLFLSTFLFIYYGSWAFSDIYLPGIKTLGNSYARYWLPIYIFSLPLTVMAGLQFKKVYSYKLFLILVICFLATLTINSIHQVYYHPITGLKKVSQDIQEYRQIVTLTQKIIPVKSFIIVDKEDKIFFPEFNIIKSLPDNTEWVEPLKNLIWQHEVYYFNPEPGEIKEINQVISSKNLVFKPSFSLEDYIFYRLITINNEKNI